MILYDLCLYLFIDKRITIANSQRTHKNLNYFIVLNNWVLMLANLIGGITELSRPGFSKTLVLV